jgi:16S rRNA (cytidine1402-2'-O)-methyltransferase
VPAERKAGCLYLVATPIGNLADISRRAAEILGSVDFVFAEDTRHTRKLMSHLDISVPLRAYHQHNEAKATPIALEQLVAGAQVALVSDAGTPAVSDPGARLVEAAIAADIRVVPIPGPSAVLAALVASGLPTERFTFLGYPPRKAGELKRFLDASRDDPGTLVLLESPRRLATTLAAAATSFGDDRRVCIAREMTKAHEEFIRGSLAELIERIDSPPRGEVTLVIEGHLEQAPGPVSDEEIVKRYSTLLAQGLKPREALKELAQATGMRRRDVYGAIHLVSDTTDPDDDPAGDTI